MLRWGLEFSKSQIVLEDKVVVLISTLFKLFIMMLVEELLGKLINVCSRGARFIGGGAGISSRLNLIADFKGFTFSKVYKRLGV